MQVVKSRISFFIVFGIIISMLMACNDMQDFKPAVESLDNINDSGKIWILNEGLFNMNNSGLTIIDLNNKTMNADYFNSINKRNLGDTSNDMALYDGKIWIVVSVSSQIEVIDVSTGISVRRIGIFDKNGKARQPRNIAFGGSKAYICSFDGTISRIDIPKLSVDTSFYSGRNPDGICIANENIYVSNSGGLDAPEYDNTVSIFSTKDLNLIRKVETGLNPFTLQADLAGNVYVISRGNYGSIPATLMKINKDLTVDSIPGTTGATDFIISNDTAFVYYYNHSTAKFQLLKYDCHSGTILDNNFLKGNFTLTKPYGISIQPENGNIYISDALNYTVKGDLYCFDRKGNFNYKISKVGLNPHKIIRTQ